VLGWRELKLTAIAGLAAGRPFAWVDDDVAFELRQLLPQGFELPGQPRLLLACDPARGLVEPEMEKLRSFAAENGSSALLRGRG